MLSGCLVLETRREDLDLTLCFCLCSRVGPLTTSQRGDRSGRRERPRRKKEGRQATGTHLYILTHLEVEYLDCLLRRRLVSFLPNPEGQKAAKSRRARVACPPRIVYKTGKDFSLINTTAIPIHTYVNLDNRRRFDHTGDIC